ncbi:MAG: RluA family pseudouridine synthase [Oscillospiraceae bacterium]|nr:RluA family pseudouridine synthase [Oscillospiraceae bacterium]
MRTLSITISADMAGRKVKTLLRRELRMPEGLIARVKLRPEGITLNGTRCRTVDTVREGDILTVQVGDEPRETGTAPVDFPLKVLYEDADCIVVDKPAGMACHGAAERGDVTLAAALAHRYGSTAAYHPVSRLDKGTSGICCCARSGYAHSLFIEALHTEDYRREYLLVCSPPPAEPRGCIDLPIARESDGGIKRCASSDGAPARTDYEVLAAEKGLALVRARLHTGRTHQIRVHFAAIGCPLVGDWLYGEASDKISRPALHSACLSFLQPVTGERIRLRSPLPEDIAGLGESFAEAAESAFSKGIE